MPIKREKFHEQIKGSLQETEDWWYVVLDTNTGNMMVEHEWSHVNPYKNTRSDEGTKQYSVEEFRKTDVGKSTSAALNAAIEKLKA